MITTQSQYCMASLHKVLAQSPWAQYIEERENSKVFETSEGFAIYAIRNEECYIQDIYVRPEHRNKHIASNIADEIAKIAKEAGCKYLTGSVVPQAKNSTASLLVLIAYGMKLYSAKDNVIYMAKEL